MQEQFSDSPAPNVSLMTTSLFTSPFEESKSDLSPVSLHSSVVVEPSLRSTNSIVTAVDTQTRKVPMAHSLFGSE